MPMEMCTHARLCTTQIRHPLLGGFERPGRVDSHQEGWVVPALVQLIEDLEGASFLASQGETCLPESGAVSEVLHTGQLLSSKSSEVSGL